MTTMLLALLLATAQVQPQHGFAIDTSKLMPGQAHVFTLEDNVRVTVRRAGEERRVMIERNGIVNHYTVAPDGGELRVTFSDTTGGLILSPGQVMVDGVPLDGSTAIIEPPRSPAKYYICPKDQTMLRVPHSKHNGQFKCPVDGTPMKPAVGRQNEYYLLQ